jgi:hypothetical protein
MSEDRDPFDLDALRIDPRDPNLRPKGAARKAKWTRRFIKFPWTWMDRLEPIERGKTYRLALLLVYEHWRGGGRVIVLSNSAVEKIGISRRSKWHALAELERIGLVVVERRSRKSPRITLLLTASAHKNDSAT